MMKLWPTAIVALAVALLLPAWLLWTANVETGSPEPTATLSPVGTVTLLPPIGPAEPPSADPEDAPDLTHRQSVLERFVCIECHGAGGGWAMPEDHSSISANECEDCHQRAPEPPPIAMHTTMDLEPEQAPCGACHSELAGHAGPLSEPAVSSSSLTTGQQGCDSCHGGEAEALLPSSHEDRSQAISTCIVCHETEPLAMPAVPHQVEAWAQCDFCHGEHRLTPLTGAHEGDVEGQCLNCHSVVQLPPTTQTKMVHLAQQEEGCTSCHASGSLAPLPESHAGRDDVLCVLCHKATYEETPPDAPHILAEQGPCRSCHAPNVVGTLPVDHTFRAEESCPSCHEQHLGGPPKIPHATDHRGQCTDCHKASSQQP